MFQVSFTGLIVPCIQGLVCSKLWYSELFLGDSGYSDYLCSLQYQSFEPEDWWVAQNYQQLDSLTTVQKRECRFNYVVLTSTSSSLLCISINYVLFLCINIIYCKYLIKNFQLFRPLKISSFKNKCINILEVNLILSNNLFYFLTKCSSFLQITLILLSTNFIVNLCHNITCYVYLPTPVFVRLNFFFPKLKEPVLFLFYFIF